MVKRAIWRVVVPGVACTLIGAIGGCARGDRAPAGSSELAAVAFFAGTWRTHEEGGAWTEEYWTAPAGGSMLGASRTVARGADGKEELKSYEFLQLSRTKEGVVYYASPQGRAPATAFTMVSSEGGRVVFENAEHDFPTRVVYWVDKEGRLHGRIEGREGGRERVEEWVYDRAEIGGTGR